MSDDTGINNVNHISSSPAPRYTAEAETSDYGSAPRLRVPAQNTGPSAGQQMLAKAVVGGLIGLVALFFGRKK